MKTAPLKNVISRIAIVVGVVVIGGTMWTGCGPSDEDPCDDVSCDFGVCDSESGECTNESSCKTDSQCVPGYECQGGSCQALAECESDEDCEAGVCSEAGVCVNPETCEEDGDCLARTHCDNAGEGAEGTCEPDPCNDVSCRRGVCERGTDNCVSADSCTKETQLLDCLAGQKCADDTCQSQETYCDNVTCDRGVCSFEAGGCVDAEDCDGDDEACLAGKYCNEMGRCQADLCAQNDIECEGNGVCMPATGTCQNATSCESSEDCLAEHLCVEGTCRLASVACGDAGGDGGCPGNQSCEYDEDDQTAECAEPDICETSFDCRDDRQCAGRNCLEPETCSDDFFEPNDGAGEATDFAEVARQNTLSASMCQEDTDVYSVDTNELAEATTRATMLVEVDVPPRARGLGKIELTVTGPDDNDIGSANTGALGAEGHIRVPVEIGVPDHGEYTVEVTAADDVKSAGVDYDLSANLMPAETTTACDDAIPIRVNQRISGATENGESSYLGSSCTAHPNNSNELIYRLDVDAPQEVTFHLEPLVSSADLTMSLRSRCTQPRSERACVDANGAGKGEQLTALLGEGSHYLVVQSPAELDGGPFNLTVDRVYTACSSRDNYCGDEGNAHVCAPDGGRFQAIECDVGCNPSTGACRPPEGDVCLDASTIAPSNAGTSQVDLQQLSDDYRLQPDGCLGQGESRTGGPDITYEVDVPSGKAVTAEVLFDNEVEGSMYLVEDCKDVDGTCEVGAQDSTDEGFREELTYANLSDDDETYHLVVDTGEGEQVSSAELQISYNDVVCTPDETRCGGSGDVEKCGEHGREWKEHVVCGLGCDASSCRGDSCSDAVSIPNSQSDKGSPQSYSFSLDHFSSTHTISGSQTCTGSSITDSSGKEAVFALDADKDDIVDIEWTPQEWGVMSVATDCSDLSNSCVAGNFEFSQTVDVRFTADQQQTYYLVADTWDSGSTSYGSSDLEVLVREPECDPASYSASCPTSRKRKYCNQDGLIDEETCPACDAGTCPAGSCSDPFPMSDGHSHSQVYRGTNDLDPVDNNNTGSCTFPEETAGADFVYEVDLKAQETLKADYSGASGYDTMYLLDDCSDESSCIEAVDSDGAIRYTAGSSAETVYVVMDHEDYTDGGSYNYGYTLDITVQ